VTGTSVSGDWSPPTHYSGGELLQPRLFTESDPITAMSVPSALGAADLATRAPRDGSAPKPGRTADPVWSPTTYVGRRGRPADAPAASAGPAAPAGSTAPAGSGAPAAEAEANDAVVASSRTMAIASLASRLTGFVRSILIVAALGTGAVGDAYNGGNNLPNMVYELLLGGVLSSVLIPLLVKAEAEDDDEGLAYTQRLLSIAVAALAAMTLVVTAAAPWIAAAFVPAGSQRNLTSIFATLLLPEIFFYGLGAIFMAVLNIKHVYGPGAWSPLLNNLVLIVTVAVFWIMPGPATLSPATITTPQVVVLGTGTTLGIAAQALVLVPYLRRSGFVWRWRFRARPGERGRLKEIGSLALWVLGYVVVSQIGVSVIQKVGFADGGFTVFTFADLLFQMPYGILVVSLLTAIMPRLSRAAVRGDSAAVVGDLGFAARLSAVALIPVTAGLIALGPVFGVTLFAHGETSVAGSHLIGSALAWSAFGLFPFALVMLQLRVFYAMRDGRTPTLINALMVATKVVLVLVTNAVFAAPAGTNVHLHPSVRAVEWLNISTSASYVVGAVAGHVLLGRRLGRLGFARVARVVVQLAVASAVGAGAAWGVVRVAGSVLGDGRSGAATGLVTGAVVGALVLCVVLWRLRVPEVREVVALVRR
jgi:putative peptidoglycan lipid II flippase